MKAKQLLNATMQFALCFLISSPNLAQTHQANRTISPTLPQTKKYILQHLHDLSVTFDEGYNYNVSIINKTTSLIVYHNMNPGDQKWVYRDVIPLNGDADFCVEENPYWSPTEHSGPKFWLMAKEHSGAKAKIDSTGIHVTQRDNNGIWHPAPDFKETSKDPTDPTIVVMGEDFDRLVKLKNAIEHFVELDNRAHGEMF